MTTITQEQAAHERGGGRSPLHSVGAALWRGVVCVAVYEVGTMIGRLVVRTLGVPLPKFPKGVEAEPFGAGMLVGSMLVVVAMALVAARLQGTYLTRWLALAAFAYVALAVNTAIEASIFTRFGGMFGMALVMFPAIVSCAGTVTALFRPMGDAQTLGDRARRFLGTRTPASWAWRLFMGVLAFLVICFFFGMILAIAAPQVIAYYQQESGMFRIPSAGVMLGAEALRGALSLLTALPVLVAWRGSRRGLVLVLGAAYWMLVGLVGLIQEGIMPADMRLAHSIEIGFDSFVYAAALVWLLVPKRETIEQ